MGKSGQVEDFYNNRLNLHSNSLLHSRITLFHLNHPVPVHWQRLNMIVPNSRLTLCDVEVGVVFFGGGAFFLQ